MYQTISMIFSRIMRSQAKLYLTMKVENRSEIRAYIEVHCSLRIPTCTRLKKTLCAWFPTLIFPICQQEFMKF